MSEKGTTILQFVILKYPQLIYLSKNNVAFVPHSIHQSM